MIPILSMSVSSAALAGPWKKYWVSADSSVVVFVRRHVFMLTCCPFIVYTCFLPPFHGAGLAPDFLMCRGGKPVVEGARDKLSMFCQVRSASPATTI